MKGTAKRWSKRLGLALGLVVLMVGGWAGYLRLSGNFHQVQTSAVFRSGQLSGAQFAERIRENNLRTIINLRGKQTDTPWYDDEVGASAAAGVTHIDFPISARRELTDDQIAQLTRILREAEQPILIHCEAGSDRSGLAAALFQLLVAKRPIDEAFGQLSLRFGHFPWLFSGTGAMDRTFERVVSQHIQVEAKP